jgi:hypothetical protein
MRLRTSVSSNVSNNNILHCFPAICALQSRKRRCATHPSYHLLRSIRMGSKGHLSLHTYLAETSLNSKHVAALQEYEHP